MLGVLIVAGVTYGTTLQHIFGNVDPSLAGLSIAYALSVTGLLQGIEDKEQRNKAKQLC